MRLLDIERPELRNIGVTLGGLAIDGRQARTLGR